jgi:hypothetical protein
MAFDASGVQSLLLVLGGAGAEATHCLQHSGHTNYMADTSRCSVDCLEWVNCLKNRRQPVWADCHTVQTGPPQALLSTSVVCSSQACAFEALPALPGSVIGSKCHICLDSRNWTHACMYIYLQPASQPATQPPSQPCMPPATCRRLCPALAYAGAATARLDGWQTLERPCPSRAPPRLGLPDQSRYAQPGGVSINSIVDPQKTLTISPFGRHSHLARVGPSWQAILLPQPYYQVQTREM